VLRSVEEQTNWSLTVRPELRVYPSVAVYRNATGEPGWVAASTKGHTIRLEPPAVLLAGNALDSTLRHEFLHLLVESRAHPGLPLWFREGLVLYLEKESNRAQPPAGGTDQVDIPALERRLEAPESAAAARSAFRQAQRTVAQLIARRGRSEVLSWVERGLPTDVASRL
jgi:stage II sporulation protein D